MARSKWTIALLLGLLFFLSGCKKNQVKTKEDLLNYVLDVNNGLIKSKKVGEFRFDLVYRPQDLMVAQELGENSPDSLKVRRLRAKYREHCYFLLQISQNGEEVLNLDRGSAQYGELLNTLAFRMNEYTSLVHGKDTLALADFMMDRTFGLSSSTNILLVFPYKQYKGDWIQLDLNELGLGIGRIRFKYKISDLANAPRIDFEY